MISDKTIAVVVPAYNEESQIRMVIETMPKFVDKIIVVNDCSSDGTAKVVEQYVLSINNVSQVQTMNVYDELIPNQFNRAEIVVKELAEKEKELMTPISIFNDNPESDRIILINHNVNSGVGAAIATGYKWCKDHGLDCTAVMAGDGQMDPNELETICMPVVKDDVDYTKGNRLIHRSATVVIPKKRFFGNSILSILTKIATGYWQISDTQTGYTAISKRALNRIEINKIFKRYGMPNDMLVKLNIAMCSVQELEIKPVYNIGEQSKLKINKVIVPISILLLKSFFKRLYVKYLFRDFHPLFLLYHLSFILAIIDVPYIIKVAKAFYYGTNLSFETLFAFTMLTLTGMQSLLFAMWMDIQDNNKLFKN